MKNFVKSFIKNNEGAAAAEYALILGVVGVAIVAGGLALGTSIEKSLTDSGTYIEGKTLK